MTDATTAVNHLLRLEDQARIHATTVTVRYFAAARAAAGAEAEVFELAEPPTVRGLAEILALRHGPQLAKVLPRCSYLLDEVAVRDQDRPVPDGSTLDVLPPFAGG